MRVSSGSSEGMRVFFNYSFIFEIVKNHIIQAENIPTLGIKRSLTGNIIKSY